MFFSKPAESHSVTPTRSPSISVSRYCEVKVDREAALSGAAAVVASCRSLRRASELRRKEMNELLPEFLVPMTRTLGK